MDCHCLVSDNAVMDLPQTMTGHFENGVHSIQTHCHIREMHWVEIYTFDPLVQRSLFQSKCHCLDSIPSMRFGHHSQDRTSIHFDCCVMIHPTKSLCRRSLQSSGCSSMVSNNPSLPAHRFCPRQVLYSASYILEPFQLYVAVHGPISHSERHEI